MKYVICGGEELKPNIAQKHFKLMNGNLVNIYGPTEK